MIARHPQADAYIALLKTTQQAYVERRADDYLSAFSGDYTSVMLDGEFEEDRAGLDARIRRDVERYREVDMQFSVERDWYSGDIGYAHLKYFTRLTAAKDGRVVIDTRENIIVGRYVGEGRWELLNKIGVKAKTYAEGEGE